jgi:hypothetical protein
MNSRTFEYQGMCLACGGRIAPVLVRAASPRCIDCRDARAPLRADLVERRQARRTA